MEVRMRANLALGYLKQDQSGKAVRQTDFALKLKDHAPLELRVKIYVRRSDAFRMQGRWDEALEAMEAAHALDAEGTAALLARAKRERAEAEQDSKAFLRAAFGAEALSASSEL